MRTSLNFARSTSTCAIGIDDRHAAPGEKTLPEQSVLLTYLPRTKGPICGSCMSSAANAGAIEYTYSLPTLRLDTIPRSSQVHRPTVTANGEIAPGDSVVLSCKICY
jgi:hypothetical protein